MIKFANNNNILSIIDILPFYINKGFNSRISFNLDFIDYNNIYKRFNILKTEEIIV